ncbi:MAG TPA: Spo0E family sporulation regulatory protein-aspartic acid phosphatase [Clostridiales bacterium]|nr:Spo0E family sporulation regulatory protein-aspartic acid phosphatase [Clostridiales bacterium]
MKKFAQQIDDLRIRLNDLIRNNADYKEIYKVSVELDELIAQFYDREAKAAC